MPTKAPATPYSLFEQTLKLKVPLESENILGRESGLKTETMSRRHCQIVTKENRWFLADLDSTNGTFLNGKKMKPREWYSLKVGDEVEFGAMVFKFNGPPSKAEANVEMPRAETVSMTQPRDGAATSRMKVPAAAPKEETNSADAAKSPAPVSKGFLPRFAACMIDGFAIGLIDYIIVMSLGLNPQVTFLVYIVVLIAVVLVPTIVSGQSLGKMMLGLRVVSDEGTTVAFKNVFLREMIGKLLIFTILPGMIAGLVAAFQGAVGSLVIVILFAAFLFKYRRDHEAFWDLMFRTRVVGMPAAETEDE